MKHTIIFTLCVFVLFSCSKEIKDGPFIYFSNNSEIPDTAEEDENININIAVVSNGYKVTQSQLYINTVEYFDTIFNSTDSILIKRCLSFLNQSGLKNIKIKATDEKDMYSTLERTIYIKAITSPYIYLDTAYTHENTTVSQNSSLIYNAICRKGDRNLESLCISLNNIEIYKQQNFTDSIQKIKFTYKTDSIGEYNLQFKLTDKSKKYSTITTKIIVE